MSAALGTGFLENIDCMAGLAKLPAGCADFVFADLPYGQTANAWDQRLPMAPLWAELNRVCKRNAAMVFTAIQPFTSLLVTSNLAAFRYSMVWEKNYSTGFLSSQYAPLRNHEDIVIFARETPPYAPQTTTNYTHNAQTHHGGTANYATDRREYTRNIPNHKAMPRTILTEKCVPTSSSERIHPTQKPEALPAWFIRTYTKPGDLVLDPTAGSATTLVAAKRLGRSYIGFETDPEMYVKAQARLDRVDAMPALRGAAP